MGTAATYMSSCLVFRSRGKKDDVLLQALEAGPGQHKTWMMIMNILHNMYTYICVM